MTMGEPNENLQYLLDSKNKETTTKKEKQDEFVQGGKKTFRPLYFQISYFLHFWLVLNNLKSYESAI
jgi:hypothetical protein